DFSVNDNHNHNHNNNNINNDNNNNLKMNWNPFFDNMNQTNNHALLLHHTNITDEKFSRRLIGRNCSVSG
uniref:Uncharacterized protein n=1 Tax=Trichobilharzia regenti TaxID=157069 RepID=A0AA85JAG6_TRIRE